MNILCFDTSFADLYVAFGNENGVVCSKFVEHCEKNYASVYLASTICEILHQQNILAKDIDFIGVNAGPGSFTGIRATVSVADVIANELNIKKIQTNSFEILSKLNKSNKLCLVALDARKNNCYFGLEDSDIPFSPMIKPYEEVIGREDSYFVIADSLASEHFKSALNFEDDKHKLGELLFNCVLQKAKKSQTVEKFEPIYLQEPFICFKPKNEVKNV